MRIILACCLILSALLTRSQDNHYNWMQFGSRNSIVFNAGVSRFEDQSAVIMNPATLTGAETSSFNFNTNVIAMNNITFEDGFGKGFTVKTSQFNVLPSMASGVFKPRQENKKWTMGYALYHSMADQIDFSDRVQDRRDLIPEAEGPGLENYLAQYNLFTKLDNFTAVIGLGWKLNEKLSFGISQSFGMRTQNMREVFSAYAITDPALGAPVDLVGSNLDYAANYSTVFTFTKMGLTYHSGDWDLGLTITSPTLRLTGKGRIISDLSLTNVRLTPSSPRRNYLANGLIEDLKAEYKHPVQVTIAAARSFQALRLYASASWYGALDQYNIMDPGTAEFIQPPSDDNVLASSRFLRVWSQNRSVVNASAAADWTLSNNNHILASIRTDYHYGVILPEEDGFNPAKKVWNNYHITVGNQRQFAKSALIFGIRYSYGRNDDYPQPVSFEDPAEGNLLQGNRGTGTVRSSGLQFLLSYMFNIGRK